MVDDLVPGEDAEGVETGGSLELDEHAEFPVIQPVGGRGDGNESVVRGVGEATK